MPITPSTPITIPFADIPYDRFLVSLVISPVIQGSEVEGAMVLRVVPYRVLPDGTLDAREDLAKSESCGAVFAAAATDPALATAVQSIMAAIQGYLTAKGY